MGRCKKRELDSCWRDWIAEMGLSQNRFNFSEIYEDLCWVVIAGLYDEHR